MRKNTAVWMVLLLAVAGYLRLWNLGAKSLWADEAISAALASATRADFWRIVLHREANMAFYYLLLRIWNVVGSSEFALRSLSVLAGVLAVPLLYGLGCQVFDPRTGRISALFLALSPLHIAYSQEARSYGFLILFSVLATSLLLMCCEKPAKSWYLYIVASVVGLYSHVMFGLTLIGHSSAVGFSSELRTRSRNFLAALGAVAVLALPLAYWLFAQGSHLGWIKESPIQLLAAFFSGLAGPKGKALLLAYVLLIACGLLLAKPSLPNRGSRVLWASLWAPVLLTCAMSWRIPFLVPRYLSACLPPFLLLAARGAALLPNRWWLLSGLGIMVSLSLQQDFLYQRLRADSFYSDDWRGAVHSLMLRTEPGDSLLFPYAFERVPAQYYLNREAAAGRQHLEVLFPAGSVPQLLSAEMPELGAEGLQSLASRTGRVWTLSAIAPNEHLQRVELGLQRHCVREVEEHFGSVRLERKLCRPELR